MRRFASRKSLIAFAGIDPAISQSGQHEAQGLPATKRGSPHLRKALFLTVNTCVRHRPPEEPVYQFYAKKRAEGKKYYVCTTAAANKFLRIYYARVMEYLAQYDSAD